MSLEPNDFTSTCTTENLRALTLGMYNYQIVRKRSTDHTNADTLSRLPLCETITAFISDSIVNGATRRRSSHSRNDMCLDQERSNSILSHSVCAIWLAIYYDLTVFNPSGANKLS